MGGPQEELEENPNNPKRQRQALNSKNKEPYIKSKAAQFLRLQIWKLRKINLCGTEQDKGTKVS